MASFDNFGPSFDKDTPVLRITRGKNRDATWVLWPIFAWRVVAPVPQERKLNLFQRSVLGLACAGVVSIEDVADRLLLSPDLAALVVHELQSMALVDYAGVPSTRGVRMLNDMDDDAPDEMRVGHVFSDPFTGKLWPRFLAGDLPIADVELNDKGWPTLLSGSAGDPWKDRAFCVLPTGGDAIISVRPNAIEILRAARRHRRQRNIDEVDDQRDVPLLKRVSFVDESPSPYLLALRVCRHKSGDWMIDDPFGHGEASDLRSQLEERLDRQEGLRSWLAPFVGDPSAPNIGELQIEATWIVEERLTVAIRQHEMVLERLVAMQRSFLETTGDDVPLDKWDDVLVKAQKAVERTLHVMQCPYLDEKLRLHNVLAERDKEFNHRYLNAIAGDLGFHTPLPEGLSAVRRGKVQFAERGMKGGLQPILLVALLWAEHELDHPLRVAGQRQPDLLHRLHRLASARDRFAAHDGPAVLPQTVADHVETAYIAAEILLLSN